MKELIKSVVAGHDPVSYSLLQTSYDFLEGGDKECDSVFKYIRSFYIESNGQVPDPESLVRYLAMANENGLVVKLKEWLEDSSIPVFDNSSQFYAHLISSKQLLFDRRLHVALQQVEASSHQTGSEAERAEAVIKSVSNITELVSKLRQEENRDTSFIYGDQAVEDFRQDYGMIRDAKDREDILYFGLGFKEFERILMKKGDLLTIAGFTSQGKSVWLRYLSYHMAIRYGFHVGFFTLEMGASVVRRMFWLMHSNNKKIFPSAPRITYDDYVMGLLTDDQIIHLDKVAIPDLAMNPNYGTLWIEQPGQSKFTIPDLKARVDLVERGVMDLDVVALDYLTLMNPDMGTKSYGTPQRSDYNQMFIDLKRYALSHKGPDGSDKPLLIMTGMQISRHRYEQAVKDGGIYDITASSEYVQSEQSSDVLVTSFMTPEMREKYNIRLQVHKNRGGAVPPIPVDFHIDLPAGQQIGDLGAVGSDELIEELRNIL